MNHGVELKPDDDTPGVKIPKQKDFCWAYSTWQGEVSWRDPLTGSIYIQALCKVILADTRRDKDWTTFLEHAQFKTNQEFNRRGPKCTQCPNYHSTLDGKVWFPPNDVQKVPVMSVPSGSQKDDQEISLAFARCSLDSFVESFPSKPELGKKRGDRRTNTLV
jgi:Caspase domain